MFLHALPFAGSLLFLPIFLAGLLWGGFWIALLPLYGLVVVSLLDRQFGLNSENLDTETPEERLIWHRLITWVWVPQQMLILLAAFWGVFRSDHLSVPESVAIILVAGMATGGIGINYAHELIHQRNRFEQRLGRLLLVSALYGHFATEHVLVHHTHVGTPRDPVTARYNETFYRFFPRVLGGCLVQSWVVERERLARKGLAVWHPRNPFWGYGLGALGFLTAAFLIGGGLGVAAYVLQAFVAVWQLELVNYVEHYGLTRKHLGEGRYEPVKPRHSWNSAHRITNWLLINLQRHSDHHYRPDRRYPLLQTYPAQEAPQLPYGYPVMCAMAMMPRLWRRVMNVRVQDWRAKNYPEITDWKPYSRGLNPVA